MHLENQFGKKIFVKDDIKIPAFNLFHCNNIMFAKDNNLAVKINVTNTINATIEFFEYKS